jgi:hypothetical protein
VVISTGEGEFIDDNDAQDMNECDLAPSAQAQVNPVATFWPQRRVLLLCGRVK